MKDSELFQEYVKLTGQLQRIDVSYKIMIMPEPVLCTTLWIIYTISTVFDITQLGLEPSHQNYMTATLTTPSPIDNFAIQPFHQLLDLKESKFFAHE